MTNQHRCRNAYILATRDAAGKPARMVIFPDERLSLVLGDFDETLTIPANPPLVQYLDELQATAIWHAIERFSAACEAARRGGDDDTDIAEFRRLAALVIAPELAGCGPESLAA